MSVPVGALDNDELVDDPEREFFSGDPSGAGLAGRARAPVSRITFNR